MKYNHESDTMSGSCGMTDKEWLSLVQKHRHESGMFFVLDSDSMRTEYIINMLGLEHTKENIVKVYLLLSAFYVEAAFEIKAMRDDKK